MLAFTKQSPDASANEFRGAIANWLRPRKIFHAQHVPRRRQWRDLLIGALVAAAIIAPSLMEAHGL